MKCKKLLSSPQFLLSITLLLFSLMVISHPSSVHAANVNSFTGTVFIDANSNGTFDTGESGYSGAQVREDNQTAGTSATATTNASGAYNIQLPNTGKFCISLVSVPSGYTATTTTGPTACYSVLSGTTNTTSNSFDFGIAPPASGGNISSLNFGINNSFPWIQAMCGDIRIDNGISDRLPAGQAMITNNASCTNPGVVFTGDSTATFGSGTASSTNQVVGGATYPEVYVPPGTGGLFSSYAYLTQKEQTAGITPTDLSTVCTLANCILPANLPHGLYQANSNVVLNAYTFPANQDYVFLINGSLTINGNISIPVANNTSAMFVTSGNIIIPATVGNPAAVTTANLAGIFSTDRSFIMNTNGNCTDLRLNVEGTVIVNAARSGGSLQDNRDLCGSNPTTPTLHLTQRLDFVLNLPDFVKIHSITSNEVAP